MVKIPFWTNWITKQRAIAYQDGFSAHCRASDIERDNLIARHKEELKAEFKRGRDFEFRTINSHLENLYKYQPSEDAMFLLHRWRETLK